MKGRQDKEIPEEGGEKDEHKSRLPEKGRVTDGKPGGVEDTAGASGRKEPPRDIIISSEELEAIRKKAAQADAHWDRILRLQADFENTKKRLEKKTDELVAFANESLLLEVLPVVDDLDRALTSFDNNHEREHIREGLSFIQDKFHRILSQHGVEPIESVGKPFDPHLHEAVGEVAHDAFEDGTVAEEVQRGYLLNGRLVRASRVRVAKKKPKSK